MEKISAPYNKSNTTEKKNLEKTSEILPHKNTAAEILTSYQEKDVENIVHEATKEGFQLAKKEAQSTTSLPNSETKCSEGVLASTMSGEQLDPNSPPQDKDEIKDDQLGEKSLEENTNLDQSTGNEINESEDHVSSERTALKSQEENFAETAEEEDPVSLESMALKSQEENFAETAEDEGEMTDYCVVTAEEIMEGEKHLHVTESTGASFETLHSFRPELGGVSLDETQLHNRDTIKVTEVSSESININQPSFNETLSDNDATFKIETTDASNNKSDSFKLEPKDALTDDFDHSIQETTDASNNTSGCFKLEPKDALTDDFDNSNQETTDASNGDSDSPKDKSDTTEQETYTIYKHDDDTVQQETGVYLNSGDISHLQASDISLHSTNFAETPKISLCHDNFIDQTNLVTGNMSSDNALYADSDKSDIIFGTSIPSITDNISSISENSLSNTDDLQHEEEKCIAENRDTVSSSTETEARLEDISLVHNEEQVLHDSLNSSAQGTDSMLDKTDLSAAGINVDPVSEATETSSNLECLSETKKTAETFKSATSVSPEDKEQSSPPHGFSKESNEFPESSRETHLTPDILTEVAADEPPLDETVNRNIYENIINKAESIVTSEDTRNEHFTTVTSKEEEGGASDQFHSLDQDFASGDFAVSSDCVSLPTKDKIEHERDSAHEEHKDDHLQPLEEDAGNLNTMPKSFNLIAESQIKETSDSCASNTEGTSNEPANNDEDRFGKVPIEQQDNIRNTEIKADRKAGCSGMSLTRAFLQLGVVTLIGVGSAAVTPIALAAAGFEAGGIAAGSVAEYLMTLTSSAGFGMYLITLLEEAGTDSLGVIPQVFVGFMSAATAGSIVLTSVLFRGKKQSASVSNDVTAAKERKTDLSTSTVSTDDQSDERANSDDHNDQHQSIIKNQAVINKEIETCSSSIEDKNIDESVTKASKETDEPMS